jgi:hypothetical protein
LRPANFTATRACPCFFFLILTWKISIHGHKAANETFIVVLPVLGTYSLQPLPFRALQLCQENLWKTELGKTTLLCVLSSSLIRIISIIAELFHNSRKWRKHNNINDFCPLKGKLIVFGGVQLIVAQWTELVLSICKFISEIFSFSLFFVFSFKSATLSHWFPHWLVFKTQSFNLLSVGTSQLNLLLKSICLQWHPPWPEL